MFAFGKPMNRILPLVLIVFCICTTISAAIPEGYVKQIDLPITVRVDTTDVEVKAVYDLVRNFLSARPDSLYDNPYWNNDEKEKYPEPFSARPIIFQSPDIINLFPPLVLSVEKEQEYYCARLLFYRQGLEEPYKSSNPWAILRLYAKKTDVKKTKEEKKTEKESGIKDHREYRLYDPLKVITKDRHHKRVGPIDYYFPLNYYFEQRTAQQMAKFCQGIKNKYSLPDVEPIEFYIARNVDELYQTAGLDYFLGPTAGRSHAPNAQVFSSLGSEWYPHEIVHVFFRDFKPHFILMEGIATLEGGSMNRSFDELVKELDSFFTVNDTLTFQNILDSPYLEGGSTIFYTTGAVLCKMAWQKGGAESVKTLLSGGYQNEELYQTLESVLGVTRDNITQVLRAKVKEYAAK